MNDEQFASLRERMVRDQLEVRDITDRRILEAMRRVPRHRFVPSDQAINAYDDRALPIGFGQTISQPLMVAVMLQEAKLTGSERVLEVGAGSGYQAALLGELAAEVVSVERIAALAEKSGQTLKALNYENVRIVLGDGTCEIDSTLPFDRILVAAGAPRIPETLVAQLAPGGRLIIPIGPADEQTLTVITKDLQCRVLTQNIGACAFVPLIGTHGWPDSNSGPNIHSTTAKTP